MRDLKYKEEQAQNQVGKTLPDFVDYYNTNTPVAFPRASVKLLASFQLAYPSLFDEAKLWTIDKHRKKLMDWLTANQTQN